MYHDLIVVLIMLPTLCTLWVIVLLFSFNNKLLVSRVLVMVKKRQTELPTGVKTLPCHNFIVGGNETTIEMMLHTCT